MALRTSFDSRGDVEEESESTEQGDARPRSRKDAHGAARKKTDQRYQENGQRRTDGTNIFIKLRSICFLYSLSSRANPKQMFQASVKIMAKDLVRTRKHIKKFTLMKANIQGVSLKIQTLRSQNAMAGAMRGVTRAMQNMNR